MQDAVFSPSFGNRPSRLVGREHVITGIVDALKSAPGSKQRTTLLLGQRGSGKTVLLWELADRARAQGFIVASPTVVSSDMPERIIEKIQDDGERYFKKHGKLTGGTVGALGFSVGLQFSSDVQETKSFGYKLLKLSERLESQKRGVLILVDEVQANSAELKQLISAYLELVGEGRNAALVLAGLPAAVSSVLNDKVLTFLNRAHKIELEPLKVGDVDAYYAQSFEKLGLDVDADLRRTAAQASAGSPYLMQLIGHNLVQYAGEDGKLSQKILDDALYSAKTSFMKDVCETTLAALSDKDRAFLSAMVDDDTESNIADIAQRMNVETDYAQKYRKRLMDSGVIASSRRGYVAFAVPYLADYLREYE